MYHSKTFMPKATAEDNQQQSDHWFGKACQYELEGKSDGILKMALNKALDFETAARSL